MADDIGTAAPEKPMDDIAYQQWLHVSPRLKWIYTPHRLFLSALFAIFIIVVRPQTPLMQLIVLWIFATIILATCLQDGPLIRPHPFFWRCVLSFSLIQMITLLALSLLGQHKAREFFVVLTPGSAGEFTLDRDYSMSCAIYDRERPDDPFHNVKSVIYDEFMVAHVLGWVAHAVLIRHWGICWTISILFEICERWLKHWFPNFNECWWDSVVLDVLLCNWFGIWLGMWLVKYFTLCPWETRLLAECRGTDWVGRVFKQFTPRSYQRYDWKPFETLRRYYMSLLVIVGLNVFELNIFGLKMVLKLKPTNAFVVMYLFLHAFHALPSIMETYQYAIGQSDTIGNFTVTFIMLVLTETFVIFRCRDGYFTEPIPLHVKITVPALTVIVLFLFPAVWFGLLKKGKSRQD
jgi:phosphatidylserine synthase 2